MAKPLIPWVGGKRRLLKTIREHLPSNIEGMYYEPFVGGGALFFDLLPKRATISDYNHELITFYKVVRDKPHELIDHLKKYPKVSTKEEYYEIRNLDRSGDFFNTASDVEIASRFLFLLKRGFSGIYHLTKKGFFSTSAGELGTKIPIDQILDFSKILHGVSIVSCGFETHTIDIERDDFFYFDPPYIPLPNKNSKNFYSANEFNMEDQVRLLNMCKTIDSLGAKFMLSNSYTPESLELYKDFEIEIVETKRQLVGSKSMVKEVLVKNYF